MNLTSNELQELRNISGLTYGTIRFDPYIFEEYGTQFRQLHTGKFVKYMVENDTIIVTNVSELLCG